jgi:hypothetical protein
MELKEIASLAETGAAFAFSAKDKLEEAFQGRMETKITDLQGAVEAAFQGFGNTWRSCYPGAGAHILADPAFSPEGDLVFSLLPAA